MNKHFTANRCLPIALTLAAVTAAGTAKAPIKDLRHRSISSAKASIFALKNMSIRSTLIVATTIATLGLVSSASAATNGGYSNDSGNIMPSYYGKDGWHLGLPPEALRARAAPPRQSARPGRGLYLYAGPSRGLSAYGSIALQNDWFWGPTFR
jgi:hypothetical protein